MRIEENGNISDLLGGPIGEELVKQGMRVRNAAVRMVHEPGHGRLYQRRSVVHQASAPGEPFATDTGITAASITSDEIAQRDTMGLVVHIGSNAKNARILELGGWTGRNHATYIAPRPYLRPALEAVKAGPL